MNPALVAVWLLGLLNLAYGLYALLAPAAAGALSGFGLEDPKARGEFRTVFGGLVIGLSVAMLAGSASPHPRAWWTAVAVLFGGLVLGRLASLFLDGVTLYTAGLGTLEAGCGVVCLWAARSAG